MRQPAAAMTAVLGLVSNGKLDMARNLVRAATSDKSLLDADIDAFIQRESFDVIVVGGGHAGTEAGGESRTDL